MGPSGRSMDTACFNPRLPHGRRQAGTSSITWRSRFQSTPPAREATRRRPNVWQPRSVSIHASRTGGDFRRYSIANVWRFNPRLPHGRRPTTSARIHRRKAFQSTPPAREATSCEMRPPTADASFNPRLPHGRRLSAMLSRAVNSIVSIHASRTGGDVWDTFGNHWWARFNPRLPHGRRLSERRLQACGTIVSIHASRTGGDHRILTSPTFCTCFNPRLPHGRRLQQYVFHPIYWTVSIHASRTGGDCHWSDYGSGYRCFNPRLPHGRRRLSFQIRRTPTVFQSTPPAREATVDALISELDAPVSIHASRTGGDPVCSSAWASLSVSIHASRTGGDSRRWCRRLALNGFNPRLPHGRRPWIAGCAR